MKYFNIAKKYGAKAADKASTGLLVASVALASSSAFAAFTPPAGLAAAATDLEGGVDYMQTLFWPIVIASFVALKLFSLFKRFGNKV
ncbi:major coat protein [Aeromonas enteropelogenes]|uniref:major coat protein n=1 Tax=Aeromonas enteropelogenes TaxID=29489 RepID=UPI003BA102C5